MGGKSGQALQRYRKLPQAVENMFWFLPRKTRGKLWLPTTEYQEEKQRYF
jgi:hypothetical protein